MIQDVNPGHGAIGLVQETEDLKLKVCHRGHLSDICKIEPPGGWRDARNSAPRRTGHLCHSSPPQRRGGSYTVFLRVRVPMAPPHPGGWVLSCGSLTYGGEPS
nr:MAG TPA: hypothetical protein [Caudoviricetes sp.]